MFDVVDSLYALIASGDWVPYSTIPADFKGEQPAVPFLKVSVPSGTSDRIAYSSSNKRQLEGVILVLVITESGNGQKQGNDIGAELLTTLEDRWLDSNTQCTLGSVQFLGRDPDDDTKSITQVSVPFRYIGD